MLRAWILTDNTPSGELCGEWGLSVYIEYEGRRYLLDAGQTDLFLQNAQKLGLRIEDVDYAALSHAHYDHSDGMDAFFRSNDKASFYLRSAAKYKCYDRSDAQPRYIGIKDGILDAYASRIVYLNADAQLNPGAHLLGHSAPGLSAQGARMSMYVRQGDAWRTDDFAHEQSMVFEVKDGLVVFSSCSHAGADVILREVAQRFPGRAICAIIGGLHLYKSTEAEVRSLARRMRETGVRRVITGHCTGDAAYALLQAELPGIVEPLCCGKYIEL